MVNPKRHAPLIAARKAKRMTQIDLAKAIESAQSTVSRIENGNASVTPQLAARIAAVLEVSEMQLLYPTRFGSDNASGAAG